MSAENTQCRMAVNVTPVLGEVQLVAGPQLVAIGLTQPDARRLAACWNACKGMETEALEKLPEPFSTLLSPEFLALVDELAAARALLRRIADAEFGYGEWPTETEIRTLLGDA